MPVENLAMQHPFPCSTLLLVLNHRHCRLIGEVAEERVEVARMTGYIFITMIKEACIYNEVSLQDVELR